MIRKYYVSIVTFLIPYLGLAQQLDWGIGLSTEDPLVEDIAVGSDGAVYVTGRFNDSIDLDPGLAVAMLRSSGNPSATLERNDLFLAKYDKNGGYLWGYSLGNPPNGGGLRASLALDAQDNIYLTGTLLDPTGQGVDLDFGAGEVRIAAGLDLFLLSTDANGTYRWGFGLGIPGGTFSQLIRPYLTVAGDAVYLAGGYFDAPDMDPDPSQSALLPANSTGSANAFLARYDTSGQYQWAQVLADTTIGNTSIQAIASNGQTVVVSGRYRGTIDLDPSTGQDTLNAKADGPLFLATYTPQGSYRWGIGLAGNAAQDIGSSNSQAASALAIDTQGEIYVGGYFDEPEAYIRGTQGGDTLVGIEDAFLARFDQNGSLRWAFRLGEASLINDDDDGEEQAINQIRLRGDSLLYVMGQYGRVTDPSVYVDLDPGPGQVLTPSLVSTEAIFVATYDANGAYRRSIAFNEAPAYRFSRAQALALRPDSGWVMGFDLRFSMDINPDSQASEILSFDSRERGCVWAAYNETLGGGITSTFSHTLSKLSLFPNPTSGRFRLQHLPVSPSPWKVKVYDMQGKQRWEQQFPHTQQLSLDLSHLSPSAYVLVCENPTSSLRTLFYIQ